ncbi:hypothetical protein H8S95_16420 [Pontibacter sp. KCTC 32443]|uniref:hypothetical protein n=1 Tax=Pontibacter TaxID=323449 RepID=UPI00164D41C5|nr:MULTISPECIES: hypothetical protein [Pontibacter]MBC5775664.1 hypothetical protein [Pontibacter sp. KCTC 32443]
MKQVIYTSLLALVLLTLVIIAQLFLTERADLVGKALNTGLPRIILPLIVVTIITHVITVKTRLIASTSFIARLIAGTLLFASTVAAITACEKFPLMDDLVLAIAFFACIILSYRMVNKVALIRVK